MRRAKRYLFNGDSDLIPSEKAASDRLGKLIPNWKHGDNGTRPHHLGLAFSSANKNCIERTVKWKAVLFVGGGGGLRRPVVPPSVGQGCVGERGILGAVESEMSRYASVKARV